MQQSPPNFILELISVVLSLLSAEELFLKRYPNFYYILYYDIVV